MALVAQKLKSGKIHVFASGYISDVKARMTPDKICITTFRLRYDCDIVEEPFENAEDHGPINRTGRKVHRYNRTLNVKIFGQRAKYARNLVNGDSVLVAGILKVSTYISKYTNQESIWRELICDFIIPQEYRFTKAAERRKSVYDIDAEASGRDDYSGIYDEDGDAAGEPDEIRAIIRRAKKGEKSERLELRERRSEERIKAAAKKTARNKNEPDFDEDNDPLSETNIDSEFGLDLDDYDY